MRNQQNSKFLYEKRKGLDTTVDNFLVKKNQKESLFYLEYCLAEGIYINDLKEIFTILEHLTHF